MTLMTLAAYFEKPEIVTYLHSIGCDVSQRCKNGETPLLRACYYKKFKSIDELLRLGADINEKSTEYPLVQALYRQNLDLTRFLLDRGADPTIMFNEEHADLLNSIPQNVRDALIGYKSFKARVPMLFTYRYGNTILNKLPSYLAKEAIMFMG